MAKTTNQTERLAAIRAAIAETKAEIQRVQTGRLPLAEAAARIPALVDALAQRWTPLVAALGAPESPTPDVIVQAAACDPWTLTGMLAHAAHAARDGLESVLRGALEATYEAVRPEDCIPLAERPGRLEALATKLHELEVAEEEIVCRAAQDGVRLDRRADASDLRRPRRIDGRRMKRASRRRHAGLRDVDEAHVRRASLLAPPLGVRRTQWGVRRAPGTSR